MKKYVLFALIAFFCLSSHSAWAQRTVPMNSSIPTDGLVAYYPFNGNANDESGNGNHGILEGNKNVPELTTDRYGNANSAYDFGGYYNYNWIKVPNSETLVFDKEMTISFWIEQSEFAGMDGWMRYSTSSPGFAAICKAGDGNATFPGLYIMTGKGSNGNGISVSTNNSNGNAHYQSNWNHSIGANKDDYQLGDWLLISLVVNNTDKILYLNGVEVARDELNREANFSSMNGQNLYIGIMAGGNMTYSMSFGAWYPFYGKIDDVRIYKRALTESEIKALYQFDDSSVSNIIYTVSPSNWTDVPSTNVTQGSRTIHGGLLQAMATVSGRTATFTLKKKDGSEFNNRGHIVVHYDSYDGTIVKSNVSYEAGITNPTVDVDLGFTSGRRKYVIVIKSGDIFYYTKPITISADDSFSDVDLAIAGGSYFNTPILTTGKPFPFNIEIKNNSSEDWNGSFYLKCGKEDWLQWYEVSIEAGETKALLTKTYTPQTSGRKTLTLYYQTGGSGGGVEVDAGNFDNPFTISVADPPSSDKLATPDKNTFSATNVTETSFVANWGAVEGALYYDINVKKKGGDYANPVFCGGSSTTHVKVTGLNPGTSYQFQIRARNGSASQNSDWSASLPAAVTTMKSGTQPANLSIYAVRGFDGKTPLTVGIANTYKVYVVNNGASDWSGSFYLKDGDANLKPWHNISLVGNGKAVQPLEFDYIPESIGKKTLTLYYQTNTSGSGIPVGAAVDTNPMTVEVIADPSVNDELKLKSAIVCPETLDLGQKATISAEVQNSGDTECAVFLTDDNTVISSRERVAPGQSKTINTTWEPTTSGTHSIAVYYKVKGSSGQKLVTANGFSNPISSSVNKEPIDMVSDEVKLKYLTKELSPQSVTEGTEVYYHYRVTDMNDNPIKGLVAVFSPVDNNSILVNSSESDDDGFLTLCLKTEGDESVASPGTTVTLSCIDINKNDGHHYKLYGANSNEHSVSLTVLNKTIFENAEKVNLSIDLGLSAKAELTDYLKGQASVSVPMQFGWVFDDDNNFSNYILGIGVKGEVGCTADLGKTLLKLKGVEVGGKAAIGYESSYQSEKFKPAIWALVYNVCNSLPPITDWRLKFASDVYKAWYEESDIEKPVVTQNGFVNLSFGGGFDYTFDYPTAPGLKNKIARLPQNIGITDFAIKGNVAAKWAFNKIKEDWASGDKTYCNSTSLKFNVEGDVKRAIKNDLFLSKSFWLNSSIYDFYQSKILYFLQYKSLVADKNLTLSFEEDEEYSDKSKLYLTKASHEISWTSGYELSVDEIVFKGGWKPLGGSLRLSNTCSSKVTLGKGFLNYLHTKVLTNDSDKENICMAIPAFAAQSLISEPQLIYNAWKYDYFKPLTKICIPNATTYSLKESMKVEQTNSSKFGLTVNIPIYDFKVAKLSLDVGAEIELENRPSVSYYSAENNRFFPIVLRPSTSVPGVVQALTKSLTEEYIEESYAEHEESLNAKWTYMNNAQYGTGYVNNDIPMTFTTMNTGHSSIMNAKTGNMYNFVKRRRPMLAEKTQNDICTFTFILNDDFNNFYEDTNVEFSHFYPAGDLLGVTDMGDTLFVTSEVCNLMAIQGTDTLNSTQLGQFKLETTIGADDLTPFGFTEDTPLDVYYSEEGSDIWHYLGPAGMTIMTDKLGAYMIATSIKNDVIAPEIMADLDEETGLLHIKVNENIGLRVNTLSVLVNGMKRDVTAINESNFEVYLSEEDMQYMLTLYITINDLAGNQGSLFQIFNIDKDDPDGIRSVESEKDKIKIVIVKNTLKVEGAEPNTTIMLFSLKGDVIAKNKTDNSGKAQVRLNNLSSGVYIVTLSNGIAKKFLIK